MLCHCSPYLGDPSRSCRRIRRELIGRFGARLQRGSSAVDQTVNGQTPVGFEKMRAMLARASDARADEQRQVVDMLDEIKARLAPLEGFAGDNASRLVATHDGVSTIQGRLG